MQCDSDGPPSFRLTQPPRKGGPLLRTDLDEYHARVVAEDHALGKGPDVIEDGDRGSVRAGDVLNQAVQSVFFFLYVGCFADAVAVEDETRTGGQSDRAF